MRRIFFVIWRAPESVRCDEDFSAECLDALELLLSGEHAAIAFDSVWNIVMVNEAFAGFFARYFPDQAAGIVPLAPVGRGRLNEVRLILAPDGYRGIVVKWEAFAHGVLGRLWQDMLMEPRPDKTAIWREVMQYSDVARLWNDIDPEVATPVLSEVEMLLDGHIVCLKSIMANPGFSRIPVEAVYQV